MDDGSASQGRTTLVILEILPVGVLLTGVHHELLCINPPVLELLGSDEAKAGQPVEKLLPAELYALLEKRDFRGIVGLPYNRRGHLAVCSIALRGRRPNFF